MQINNSRQEITLKTALALNSKQPKRKRSFGSIAENVLTTRNQSPVQLNDYLSSSNPVSLPLEINWQKWTKEAKVNLNHPITARYRDKRLPTPKVKPLNLPTEALDYRETRGSQSLRQSYGKDSTTNSVERKVKVAEYITSLRDCLQNRNHSGSEFFIPQKSAIRKAFRALEYVSEEESLYSDLMKNTLHLLKRSLFFDKGIVAAYQSYWDSVEGDELREILMSNHEKNLIPYLTICNYLLKEVKSKDDKYKETVKRYEEIVNSHLETIKNLRADMSRELERVNKQVIADLIAKYEQELSQKEADKNHFLSEIDNLQTILSAELSEKEKMQADLSSQAKELDNRNERIKDLLEEIKLKDQTLKEQSQKLEGIQNQVRSFKKTLGENLNQLATIKELTVSLKRENEELTFERDCLKIRSAVAFEDLTPRPNYQKIMEEKRVELGIKVDTFWKGKSSKKRMRTEQVVEALLTKYITALNTNKTLEKQAKNGIQMSTLKRDSVTLEKSSPFVNRNQRVSVMNPGFITSSRFSSRNDGPMLSIPHTPMNNKQSSPNLKAENSEPIKTDSQYGEAIQALKPTDDLKINDSSKNSSPVILQINKGFRTTRNDSHKWSSSEFSPVIIKEVIDTDEKEKDQDQDQDNGLQKSQEILNVNLPEVLGLHKERRN